MEAEEAVNMYAVLAVELMILMNMRSMLSPLSMQAVSRLNQPGCNTTVKRSNLIVVDWNSQRVANEALASSRSLCRR